jgi:hypothetical protein
MVKFSPCLTNQALCYEGVCGSECTDSHFRDFDTNWRWAVSSTLLPLYPCGEIPRCPLDRRLGGPQRRSARRGEEDLFDPTETRTPIPRSSKPVASRSTDCATPAPSYDRTFYINNRQWHTRAQGSREYIRFFIKDLSSFQNKDGKINSESLLKNSYHGPTTNSMEQTSSWETIWGFPGVHCFFYSSLCTVWTGGSDANVLEGPRPLKMEAVLHESASLPPSTRCRDSRAQSTLR